MSEQTTTQTVAEIIAACDFGLLQGQPVLTSLAADTDALATIAAQSVVTLGDLETVWLADEKLAPRVNNLRKAREAVAKANAAKDAALANLETDLGMPVAQALALAHSEQESKRAPLRARIHSLRYRLSQTAAALELSETVQSAIAMVDAATGRIYDATAPKGAISREGSDDGGEVPAIRAALLRNMTDARYVTIKSVLGKDVAAKGRIAEAYRALGETLVSEGK